MIEKVMEQIDRALDVALIVIENGGSTVMADRTFRYVLKGYGLNGVSVVWRLDFAAANIEGEVSRTVLRPVSAIGINLNRVSEAVLLGKRIARQEVDTSCLISEIERIKAIVPPYKNWIMMIIAGFTAASFAQLTTKGDWETSVVAFAAAFLGQFLRAILQRAKLAVAQVTLACGVLSVSIAVFALRMGYCQTAAQAIISSIIYLVPGLPLINGFIDMVSHKFIFIGLQRIANAMYLFLILSIAIAFANLLLNGI